MSKTYDEIMDDLDADDNQVAERFSRANPHIKMSIGEWSDLKRDIKSAIWVRVRNALAASKPKSVEDVGSILNGMFEDARRQIDTAGDEMTARLNAK